MITSGRVLTSAVVFLAVTIYSLSALAQTSSSVYPSNATSITVPFVNGGTALATSPQILIGFNTTNAGTQGAQFNITMDTGSVGVYVGSNYFKPPALGRNDPSFIGTGGETLTSSGVIFSGDWYKTSVNLYNPTTKAIVATATVPVLALTSVTCVPNARTCNVTAGNTGAGVAYFGVGFGQEASGQPQGTPDKNAFLNITSAPGAGSVLPSYGYVLTTQGVQIGLTPTNTQNYAMIKLQPLLAPDYTQWQTTPASSNVLTDWQKARGLISVSGPDSVNATSGYGSILFDTGVGTGFLTPPVNTTLATGVGPAIAECNGSNPPTTATCAVTGTNVAVSFPGQTSPIASFNYTIGANNGIQSGNPISPDALGVVPNNPPFLNTTYHFLNTFNYFYDASNGFIGLQTLSSTPAQYASSTPGMSVQGVFQCLFDWVETNFVSASASASDTITQYAAPYTYRYYQNSNVYIGVSSGTTASNANNVYKQGVSDGSPQVDGPLSGWLTAAGCQ